MDTLDTLGGIYITFADLDTVDFFSRATGGDLPRILRVSILFFLPPITIMRLALKGFHSIGFLWLLQLLAPLWWVILTIKIIIQEFVSVQRSMFRENSDLFCRSKSSVVGLKSVSEISVRLFKMETGGAGYKIRQG